MTGKSDVKRYRGGCLCGGVTFEVALPATFVGHCHCSMCRRAHGAAYVTWVGVPVGMFYLTKGKETLVDYQSSDHVTRSFCGRCGSPMFCNDARHAEAAHLTLASLQGDTGLIPEAHYFFDSRADWTKVHDDLPKLGGKSGLMPL